MHPSLASAPDGTRIAYDISGAGPVLLLLHGGGQTRLSWHDAGYVERLQAAFTVVTMDIRGNGASDAPTEAAYYSVDKHCQDILAVADACGAERFRLWGFSYGGNIGRYLATRSDRVARFIMIGIPFGLGASGAFRQSILDFRDHWAPIIHAQQTGTLDLAALSQKDQDALRQTNVPLTLAWLSAMLDWGSVEPADLRCSTLWVVGSENAAALASVQEYQPALQNSRVRTHIVDGLNHMQEFTAVDQVLPALLAFSAE
jgi:pimeloyl-ACP methyl ester carboxylesterase